MHEWMEDRLARLRQFFDLAPDAVLLKDQGAAPEIVAPMGEQLARFNIEWHIIPDADAVPFDEAYAKRLYPMCARNFASHKARSTSCREALISGHARHQGKVLGIEITQKPRYLPGNRQHYGTMYGYESTADPFADYLGRARFETGTRYAHIYASLREFLDVVNADWHARQWMPKGYRLTICPPAVFNLIGSVFHREWSETETLELGFYRDDHGNAKCYAVGSNAPGDFSYIHQIETNSDWTLLGFRLALVPEESKK
jgi:hypothetical protein